MNEMDGLQALATEAGVNLLVAVGLGFVVFPFVDMLKRYLGKFGSDVTRLAYIVAFGLSLLITFGKTGGGTITGAAILAAIARGVVTALITVALGKGRQAVPDNRCKTLALAGAGGAVELDAQMLTKGDVLHVDDLDDETFKVLTAKVWDRVRRTEPRAAEETANA